MAESCIPEREDEEMREIERESEREVWKHQRDRKIKESV